jgi:nicotinamidase-related amidase
MDVNKLLVVVDMQNDFIDGSLGTKEAQEIVPKVIEKIKNFDGIIVATIDTHHEDYFSTQEGKKLPVKHCIKGEDGWRFNKKIAKELLSSEMFTEYHKQEKGIYLLDTYRKETFGSLDLACDCEAEFGEGNRSHPEDVEITLIGLCTDICVISNAMLLKTTLPEAKLIVDASCCAGVTPESHKNALEAMKMCQIEVINE